MPKIDLKTAFGNPELIKHNRPINQEEYNVRAEVITSYAYVNCSITCPHCRNRIEDEFECDLDESEHCFDMGCDACNSLLHIKVEL